MSTIQAGLLGTEVVFAQRRRAEGKLYAEKKGVAVLYYDLRMQMKLKLQAVVSLPRPHEACHLIWASKPAGAKSEEPSLRQFPTETNSAPTTMCCTLKRNRHLVVFGEELSSRIVRQI